MFLWTWGDPKTPPLRPLWQIEEDERLQRQNQPSRLAGFTGDDRQKTGEIARGRMFPAK